MSTFPAFIEDICFASNFTYKYAEERESCCLAAVTDWFLVYFFHLRCLCLLFHKSFISAAVQDTD